VQVLHTRPSFSDALAKVITGDASTTNARRSVESHLGTSTGSHRSGEVVLDVRA
jgi:hypothetical protein